jgi:hypothetical protein
MRLKPESEVRLMHGSHVIAEAKAAALGLTPARSILRPAEEAAKSYLASYVMPFTMLRVWTAEGKEMIANLSDLSPAIDGCCPWFRTHPGDTLTGYGPSF